MHASDSQAAWRVQREVGHRAGLLQVLRKLAGEHVFDHLQFLLGHFVGAQALEFFHEFDDGAVAHGIADAGSSIERADQFVGIEVGTGAIGPAMGLF